MLKTSNTQGWKLAGAQLPKAPKNVAGLLEIEAYFSYFDKIGNQFAKYTSGYIPHAQQHQRS
jgi:hypothetical protein